MVLCQTQPLYKLVQTAYPGEPLYYGVCGTGGLPSLH